MADTSDVNGQRLEVVELPPGTQAVGRALDILECFLDEPRRGVNEIARRLDLSPGTAHRLVRALVARGYMAQDDQSGRYHLGRSAVVLSRVVQGQFGLDQVLAILERVGRETGESVNMGLLDGDRVVVTMRVASPQPLRLEQPVGTRLLPHCTSMGKALLAFDAANGPPSLDTLDLPPSTAHTITTVEALAADLDAVRARGYSTDQEESMIGVSCVGAPVLNGAGRAKAALAIQAPTARMSPERTAELARIAMDVAAEIGQIYPD